MSSAADPKDGQPFPFCFVQLRVTVIKTNTYTMRTLYLICFIIISISLGPTGISYAQSFSKQDSQNLDHYLEKTNRRWQTPGMAIALIKGDSVIYERHLGLADTRTGAKVDEQTLFAIGSTTKAFTSTALAMLVDQGKIDWDDPVIQYLPDFALKDQRLSSLVTIRDLLSHRTGLSRTSYLFYNSGLSPETMMHKLRYYDAAYPFRAGFRYQNVMYTVAGLVIEKVSGMSYENFITRRILEPLGMNRTRLQLASLEEAGNVSSPNRLENGSTQPIPWRNIDNVAPAGAIISDLQDMKRWAQFQLHLGEFRGRRLVKEKTLQETHETQSILNLESMWAIINPQADRLYYGMGWFIQYYGDHKVLEHAGNIDGMSAHLALIPDADMAVVILTNLGQNFSTAGIVTRICNLSFDRPLHDYTRSVFAKLHGSNPNGDGPDTKPLPNTAPSLDLQSYTGLFENPKFAPLRITLQEGKLHARFGNFKGILEHWQHDSWKIHVDDPIMQSLFISFMVDSDAQITEAKLENIGTFQRKK